MVGESQGGGRGGGFPAPPPTPASPPPSPPQAQTRAALLRALQEDEEHWGSAEDTSSSLAQDVCEVGVGSGRDWGRGRRLSRPCGVGKWGVAPPHLFSHPGPRSCWRSTRSGRPASARSSGSGWPTAAWGGWQSSCRGMQGAGWGGRGIGVQDAAEGGDMEEKIRA